MKVCKVKPSPNTCASCLDIQVIHGVIEDCAECTENTTEHELCGVVSGILGLKAIIVDDGRLKSVPMYRVHCVREVK